MIGSLADILDRNGGGKWLGSMAHKEEERRREKSRRERREERREGENCVAETRVDKE